jgi:hypothetical protein
MAGVAEAKQGMTTREALQKELGARIYDRAESLRLRALARVGINAEAVPDGVTHDVTLRSPGYRLTVELGAGAQLHEGDTSLRRVAIKDSPVEGEEFNRGRFFEPDGSPWQMADSSQGLPWYPAGLPMEDLLRILDSFDQLESTRYYLTEVKLTALQHMGSVATAAESA